MLGAVALVVSSFLVEFDKLVAVAVVVELLPIVVDIVQLVVDIVEHVVVEYTKILVELFRYPIVSEDKYQLVVVRSMVPRMDRC